MWSLYLLVLIGGAFGQCPWSRELVDLHTDCVCAYGGQRLSVQCSPVHFTQLVSVLGGPPLDLLYVSNASDVETLRGPLPLLHGLHVAESGLREVEHGAFGGLEESLTSLSLPGNHLKEVPDLHSLTALRSLDLSRNRIERLEEDVFRGVPLTTVTLSDNHLKSVSDQAFRGLEGSLRSLHLQSAGLERPPAGIRRLRVLSLLDLAQNRIEELEPDSLSELQSLTAINLERNRIRKVDARAFSGVNATLSSLSLLNNLLDHYPRETVDTLTEIRVLDLGFNRIEEMPSDAFRRNKYLTLLALDGNPLITLPEFPQLRNTLRGLSLGGSSLWCDCRLRWLLGWMKEDSLQVTSRDRSPQFCGHPYHLRRHTFQQLVLSDLNCNDNPLTTTPASTTDVRKVPRIRHAYKRDSTLFIDWTPGEEDVHKYQVLIRLFGKHEFLHIIPISNEKHRLQVGHLPLGQCIIICIIEFEDSSEVRVEKVPNRQCRELRGNEVPSLEKVIIASSAVICLVIMASALVVLSLIRRRRKSLPPQHTDWETLSWNSNAQNGQQWGESPRQFNGMPSYFLRDNESRLSFSCISKIPSSHVALKKAQGRNTWCIPSVNGRSKRIASVTSSTESNGRWNDNDIDIYVSHNHIMAGLHRHSQDFNFS